MANKIIRNIGIYIFLDGIISVIVLGDFNLEIENIFRYIRAGIGIYLFNEFK